MDGYILPLPPSSPRNNILTSASSIACFPPVSRFFPSASINVSITHVARTCSHTLSTWRRSFCCFSTRTPGMHETTQRVYLFLPFLPVLPRSLPPFLSTSLSSSRSKIPSVLPVSRPRCHRRAFCHRSNSLAAATNKGLGRK